MIDMYLILYNSHNLIFCIYIIATFYKNSNSEILLPIRTNGMERESCDKNDRCSGLEGKEHNVFLNNF